jgi:hypothetical protein
MHLTFWMGNLGGHIHMRNIGIDDRIILKWILKK